MLRKFGAEYTKVNHFKVAILQMQLTETYHLRITLAVLFLISSPAHFFSISGVQIQGPSGNGLRTSCLLVQLKDVISAGACGESNGAVTLVAIGGVAPHLYSIDGIYFQESPTFTEMSPGAYTLYIKDANGCIGERAFVQLGGCSSGFSASVSSADCNNEAVVQFQIGMDPGLRYSIDDGVKQASNVFERVSSGWHIFRAYNDTGLIAMFGFQVKSFCPVGIELVKQNVICSAKGSLLVNGARGIPPYSYSLDGISYQGSGLFSGLEQGTYDVFVKDGDGKRGKISVTIYNECLTAMPNAENTTCGLENGIIRTSVIGGNSPYQYSIDGNTFQNDSVFTNLKVGKYVVNVKDADGLVSFTDIVIDSVPLPQLILESTNADCDEKNGGITANAIGGLKPYSYSVNGGDFSSESDFTMLEPGIYNVTLKDAGDCIVSGNVVVGSKDDISIEIAEDTTICQGESVLLENQSLATSFLWHPSNGLSNVSEKSPIASPETTTKYYVKAVLGGCMAIDSVTVFVRPAPVANVGKDTTICFGQNATLAATGGSKYFWTPTTYMDDPFSATPNLINVDQTTEYYLTVVDENGCASQDPSSVVVWVTPQAQLFAGNDTSVIKNHPLQLEVKDINNSGFTDFVWSPSTGMDNPQSSQPIIKIFEDITYSVTAKTPSGCTATDVIKIKVFESPEIYVPSAFTPNGDRKNDVLKAIPIAIKSFHYLAVYDRWGRRIFYTTDANSGWDGVNGSSKQVNGIYIWVAEGVDYTNNIIKRSGTITLIR